MVVRQLSAVNVEVGTVSHYLRLLENGEVYQASNPTPPLVAAFTEGEIV